MAVLRSALPSAAERTVLRTYTFAFSPDSQLAVRNSLLALAVASFLVQLALYTLRVVWPGISLPSRFMPASFLDTINPPLALILVYESYLLVTSTSRSIIEFVSKQFEVVSLIVLRGIFKDLSHISPASQLDVTAAPVVAVAVSMVGSLLLYYLIEVFERFQSRYATAELSVEPPSLAIGKQYLALALGAVFVGISLYYFVMWAAGLSEGFETAYFRQFFALLVVFDIAHLILSIYHLRSYTLIYEYSAFILASATVLVALPMTATVRLPLIVAALVFCIATVRLHAYARENDPSAAIEE